mmetsp:Transcript_37939/g.104723  ORF Transcript_37939/g.104723 Transcript_37939/m.104723 type:complete len:270 (+) Transcript_37939:106-915(+)
MAPRPALARLWLLMRLMCAHYGVHLIVGIFVLGLLQASFAKSSTFPQYLASGVIFVAAAAGWPACMRCSFARMAALDHEGAVAAAATVSALVGQDRLPPEQTLAVAKAKFRCLKMSALNQQDLLSNADTGLFARTIPAELGSVDCFVSHSWSDDPQVKWSALQRWAAQFEQLHGREPTLWLGTCASESHTRVDGLWHGRAEAGRSSRRVTRDARTLSLEASLPALCKQGVHRPAAHPGEPGVPPDLARILQPVARPRRTYIQLAFMVHR